MRDNSRDAIMFAFIIYAVYMEGIKGFIKAILLPIGTSFILTARDYF